MIPEINLFHFLMNWAIGYFRKAMYSHKLFTFAISILINLS